MKIKAFILIILLFIIITDTSVFAQYFGKNKVQDKNFEWQYLQSEHFDIYFTKGGKNVATFTAQVAEDSYRQLRKDFRYDLVDRIKIIVYNSHNDFGQTNVDLNPPEESVGGFTEFFKNRVVIPYEGEWEKFRHVIHHELTHAVMLQMIYGAGAQSIITGMTQFQIPLWFIEGLAEYESRGWDIESDMFMRDATVSGYLPPIDYLYAFLAYKGGQSVLEYIADRYGDEKIGELLGKIKISKSLNRGLKQSIGIDTEELTKRWQLYLKRKYWPDIENRKEPKEIAKALTEHIKDKNFINTSPSISNRGDKIVYMSDKDDYFDIFLASTIDNKTIKKLVRGQRAGNLEELHWLRGPAFAWSPDDRRIVFSAKAGAEDALHIVNVKSSDIENTLKLKFDGIYNPAWSPQGDDIAFTGIRDGQTDIYVYNLKNKNLRKLTNDIFSNVEPSWSPDGKKIVFASDRENYLDVVPEGLTPFIINYKHFNIYEINSDGTGIRKLVDSGFQERTPIYSPDGKYIAFSSDRSGVSNIYMKDLENGEEWPITNVLTGAFIPSWGRRAERMAFTSFYNAGYDIFILKDPTGIKRDEVQVQETRFVQELKQKIEEQDSLKNTLFAKADSELKSDSNETKKYRNFIFDESFAEGNIETDDMEESVFLDSTEYAKDGEFKVYDYEIKFSPDLVYGSVGYNQFFGTQGYTNITFSDVLGDHRFNIAANLFGDFRNADYAFTYLYLPNKLDIGGSVFHNAYFFWSNYTGWVRDRNYGLSLFLSNPFDRYRRISYGISIRGISREYMDLPDDLTDLLIDAGIFSPRNRFFVLNNLTYTKDTTVWGYTGPTNGSRWAVGITYSPQIGKSGIDFTTVRGDWRQYYRVFKDYSFALRGTAGFSAGIHPQKFFLGGLPNWINYEYKGGIRVNRIEDIYFASFEMPLRGADYYELVGNRFLMTNIEFRFPLIRQLLMGFPLPLYFSNVGGSIFTDIGFAWDQNDYNNFKELFDKPRSLFRSSYAFASYGMGVRLNVGFFLLRFDLAWPTDFYRSEKPSVLWSLGADF
ncbi:PD40 domain-containing protein [candidate division KSB1 bacterium]|nr:PD40 domain-containing protein [candidate division KSB1 bacterium]